MNKVYEIFGKHKIDGDVGIEIECEGENLKRVDDDMWRSENDGSLRPAGGFPNRCIEWVLDKPILVEQVPAALKSLAKYQKDAKLNFGFRTSVHVHVNCQDLSYQQLLNMVYIYFLFEEPLINFCGEGRKANRFCLRVRDAEGQLAAITSIIQYGEEGLLRMKHDRTRYSALNLEALPKYGSLEFRGMRGTLDVPILTSWVNMCVGIREAAKRFADIDEVHEHFLKIGGEAFAMEIFGKEYKHLQDVEKGSALGYSLSLDIPYLFKAQKKKGFKEYKQPKVEERFIKAIIPPRAPAIPPRPIDPNLLRMHLPEIGDFKFEDWELEVNKLFEQHPIVEINME